MTWEIHNSQAREVKGLKYVLWILLGTKFFLLGQEFRHAEQG